MKISKNWALGFLVIQLMIQSFAHAVDDDFVEYPAPQQPSAPSTPPLVATQAQLAMKDPEAFNEYLLYDNPTLTQLSTIETTWMAQVKGEKDEVTMARVEQQLSRQLQIELNSAVLPNTVLAQAISFFRQVTCNKFKTVMNGEYNNRVVNTSNSRDGAVTQVIAGGTRYSEQRENATEQGQTILVQPRNHNFSSVQGETFQMAGRTVIDITEKSYRTDCVEKRYEFRGVLNTERFIRYPAVQEDVKTILVRRGLLKLHQDFVARAKNLSEALKLVTSSSYVGPTEIKRLGFDSFDAAVSFMQMELTSLVSTYDFLKSTEDLFKTYNYIRLSKSIGGMANDARMKLDSIIATLEVYQAPHLQVALYRSSQEANSYIVFTERFLADAFAPMNKEKGGASFTFKGQVLDPFDKYRRWVDETAANNKRLSEETAAYNKKMSDEARVACLAKVARMIQIGHSATSLPQFSQEERASVRGCTSMVSQWVPSEEALGYLRSKQCAFFGVLDQTSEWYSPNSFLSAIFGMRGYYKYRYNVAILCPN